MRKIFSLPTNRPTIIRNPAYAKLRRYKTESVVLMKPVAARIMHPVVNPRTCWLDGWHPGSG